MNSRKKSSRREKYFRFQFVQVFALQKNVSLINMGIKFMQPGDAFDGFA